MLVQEWNVRKNDIKIRQHTKHKGKAQRGRGQSTKQTTQRRHDLGMSIRPTTTRRNLTNICKQSHWEREASSFITHRRNEIGLKNWRGASTNRKGDGTSHRASKSVGGGSQSTRNFKSRLSFLSNVY